jgi:hypothetical protein
MQLHQEGCIINCAAFEIMIERDARNRTPLPYILCIPGMTFHCENFDDVTKTAKTMMLISL